MKSIILWQNQESADITTTLENTHCKTIVNVTLMVTKVINIVLTSIYLFIFVIRERWARFDRFTKRTL